MIRKYDVAVVGGGSAGVAAAVGARKQAQGSR
jgi:succinate dehydrogenase/fumarate reductase flavoprotein subunit